jgi:hypothetical protein
MQMDLWPEEIKIRDADRVDLSTLKDLNINKNNFVNRKNWEFKDLPKGKYFIYKTGGINPYLPDAGPIFPYVINTITINRKNGGFVSPCLTRPIKYPRWNIKGIRGTQGTNINALVSCHVLVATAFIEQEFPTQTYVCHINESTVNNYHLWFNVENLKWGTPSQNNSGVAKTHKGSVIE